MGTSVLPLMDRTEPFTDGGRAAESDILAVEAPCDLDLAGRVSSHVGSSHCLEGPCHSTARKVTGLGCVFGEVSSDVSW